MEQISKKFQLNTLFVSYGISDVINGERVRPTDDQSEATKKEWIRDNAKAMLLISTSLEPNQLQPLLVCTTAKKKCGTNCQ